MELGSEFDLDFSQLTKTADTVFAYLKEFCSVYTDSGRSALRLLSEHLAGEKILVPDYICRSVTDALSEKCTVIYYPIDRRFGADLGQLEEWIQKQSVRVLYLMHYFGILQSEDTLKRITEWKETYGLTVIEDATHSLFTAKKTVGDYCIASLRKWFPIPDGGVLYTDREQTFFKDFWEQKPEEWLGQKSEDWLEQKPVSRKIKAMVLKNLFLTEGFDCNAKYREIFAEEEETLDCQKGVYGLSALSRFLLSHVPVKPMCRRRRENAALLREGLKGLGVDAAVKGVSSEVLLALPVYAAKRNCLRERLMEQNVYCAVHWPLEHSAVSEEARWMENHIISLPLDQRYGEEEMEYLLKCLEISKKEDCYEACKGQGGME